jgi:pimeloyl-ACP methyl ester carboxylesterase
MKDGIIRVADGRSVGYADYGMPDQIPLLWCHGAPSNRLEASFVAEAAARAGLRIIGTIGQGTGGRRRSRGAPSAAGSPTGLRSSITSASTGLSWVGASTGGAYALAVASSSPRVMCAVACCAVSDMRWPEGKAMNVSCHPVWNARDREDDAGDRHRRVRRARRKPSTATAATRRPTERCQVVRLTVVRVVGDPLLDRGLHAGAGGLRRRSTGGCQRLEHFDVTRITCPVAVLHGTADTLVPVANAYHTASIVPGATLHIVDELGHLSIVTETVALVTDLLARSATR